MDTPKKLREYIPQGDGYYSDFANTLEAAACEIEEIREMRLALKKCFKLAVKIQNILNDQSL